MKIGLSYSRCLRDLVDGTVDLDDVLVIISRTKFDPEIDQEWDEIWQGYIYSEWRNYSMDDESKFRNASIELKKSGKLHQPRQFGANPPHVKYYWLEASLVSNDLESNDAVKRAWDNFKIIAGLSGIKNSDT